MPCAEAQRRYSSWQSNNFWYKNFTQIICLLGRLLDEFLPHSLSRAFPDCISVAWTTRVDSFFSSCLCMWPSEVIWTGLNTGRDHFLTNQAPHRELSGTQIKNICSMMDFSQSRLNIWAKIGSPCLGSFIPPKVPSLPLHWDHSSTHDSDPFLHLTPTSFPLRVSHHTHSLHLCLSGILTFLSSYSHFLDFFLLTPSLDCWVSLFSHFKFIVKEKLIFKRLWSELVACLFHWLLYGFFVYIQTRSSLGQSYIFSEYWQGRAKRRWQGGRNELK